MRVERNPMHLDWIPARRRRTVAWRQLLIGTAMATIDITRRHGLGRDRAREIASGIGEDLVHRYGVQTQWQGDTLLVRRAGIEGRIEVGDEHVRMHAQLGLMVGMLKGTIEQEIQKQFERHFG